MRGKLIGGGPDPIGAMADDFARSVRAEIAQRSKVAKDVGVKAG